MPAARRERAGAVADLHQMAEPVAWLVALRLVAMSVAPRQRRSGPDTSSATSVSRPDGTSTSRPPSDANYHDRYGQYRTFFMPGTRSVPVEERPDQGEHLVRALRHADVGGPGEHGQLCVRQESEELDDVGQR
jgi:hypothetical protein